MSRFDAARRGRILVWTGAALAWGTAITIAGLEPDSTEANTQMAAAPPSISAAVPVSRLAAIPTPPAQGLVILRYRPSTDSTSEVRTEYVQQEPNETASPTLAAAPAPAPQSSGS